MIQARNEGKDYFQEGPDILEKAAKGCPELNAALQIWKDITFNFESTDVPGLSSRPRPSGTRRQEQMRITQGTFSFLPDFTDEQIEAQMQVLASRTAGRSRSSTPTTRIPRNAYWEMWGLPHFDLKPDGIETVMREVRACREAFPERVHQADRLRRRPTAARRAR